ncbi:hypothetical protein ND861_13950 [Leptospira sp. 2 VSF19]|uniref:Uncharacterized protein n=1 Tax=Leptospira soteropolitanensis TaxID=2950025 RepID=A0AAW5VR05_9LEPT|nr:hypothetical protein [Leptospira soteropolitanensis]MCW7493749.1 hypothetical protein [Leptospira soteropolitanensis]MCW7501347.1 hypothetical protein [Leptospira soteropolitanensis]MCW7523467.1 hypothetical protein [Leptospira soteropolitanensis]MCW7527461.1 hypothetical protein [Leptospira soteropolitanensis]MCW7531317.1 hypothetical protein [Leptospira soteropolitanensis]
MSEKKGPIKGIRDRISQLWNQYPNWGKIPQFLELLEKGLDKELFVDPDKKEIPIPIEDLPVDEVLRKSGFFRNFYEKLFPVSHVFRITYRYDREFLDNFMPLSQDGYIGRGSYKFVYKLPWNQVVKIGKSKLPSDAIFGSLFKEVGKDLSRFLKPEEVELQNFLKKQTSRDSKKDEIDFKFKRLGLERLHYWKLKSLIPDLVVPTRFFMGMRIRNNPFGIPNVTLTPCDQQPLLAGKHLKEFTIRNEKLDQNPIMGKLFPKWKLNFDSHRFGVISKSKLKKIAVDFNRVIEVTKYLAEEEKLIFDIHAENIIITLPDFELKIFDFHVFDDYLYEPSEENPTPEMDHIQIIEEFIKSFELD